MDHPKPWLRYVSAEHIADQTLDLRHMAMQNTTGVTLGKINGLIVDSHSGRTYYVVVDAGGWFRSRHFLVPIGQITVGDGRQSLVVDLSQDQIHRFPGFDTDEFDTLSEADLKRINDDISSVVEPDHVPDATAPYSAAWTRAPYQAPSWWSPTLPAATHQSAPAPVDSAGRAHLAPASPGSATSRAVAETAIPQRDDRVRESVPEHEVDPLVKNAHLPKGVDKPDGVLESVNDDGTRVEKRTTM